jgi:hemerythrin
MEQHVTWQPFYSVGDASLDEEHKRILGIIEDLRLAIETGNERGQVQDILNRLTHYTMTHFEHEEKVMKACGFPRFDAHKVMHDEMRRRTLDLKAMPDSIAGGDLLQFVRNWWVRHIQNQDKAYAPYLDAIARQPAQAW